MYNSYIRKVRVMDMILDLVEVKKKKNHLKIIMCIAIFIIITILCIFFGIGIIKQDNEKKYNKEQIMLSKQNLKHKIIFNVNKEVTKEKIKENVNNIYHSDEKRVFLTFDDGPSRAVTPFILDLLKEQGIKATFFTLGSRVDLNQDLVKREYEEGHYVANHGYSHIYSNIYSNAQSVLDEYNKAEIAIKNAIGDQNYESHLFRFPGGSKGGKYSTVKNEAINLLDANNIAHLDWNALTADAAGMHTKEDMLAYVKETIGTKNSVVILMHDAGDKILTYEILPELIGFLREQGYNFKNIYDIL